MSVWWVGEKERVAILYASVPPPPPDIYFLAPMHPSPNPSPTFKIQFLGWYTHGRTSIIVVIKIARKIVDRFEAYYFKRLLRVVRRHN